jgi:RNA polymerase sigma-70 factor (ECF subfamily)
MSATLVHSPRSEDNLDSRAVSEREAETQLLASVRAGDALASAAFVSKYRAHMFAVARRFLRCEADSADAVQDAFLSAFRSLERFEGNSSLGTWLHRIVVNACLMKLRAHSRSRQVPLDDLLPTFDENSQTQRIRSWQEGSLARLTREETRSQVRAYIDRLPERYRAVLLLRDIEELDTDETAQQLGITSGAVKTRLHRARLALRTLLEPVILGEQRM